MKNEKTLIELERRIQLALKLRADDSQFRTRLEPAGDLLRWILDKPLPENRSSLWEALLKMTELDSPPQEKS